MTILEQLIQLESVKARITLYAPHNIYEGILRYDNGFNIREVRESIKRTHAIHFNEGEVETIKDKRIVLKNCYESTETRFTFNA